MGIKSSASKSERVPLFYKFFTAALLLTLGGVLVYTDLNADEPSEADHSANAPTEMVTGISVPQPD